MPDFSLAALAERAATAKRPIVLCHGTFDVLHIGHLNHLKAASRMGATLFVTLTGDAHVNKGPGRPVFAEGERARMLDAIEFVDGVAVVPAPTAVPVIDAIRPDVFVKGDDYQKPDITGGIDQERRAVEAHGGRLEFTTRTSAIGSSGLINRHMGVHPPELQEYLESARDQIKFERLRDLIESLADYRVRMIGDTIFDEYRYVTTMGKASKEPIICVRQDSSELFAGGVLAAARHVASFCRQVDVVTAFGVPRRSEQELLVRMPENMKIHAHRHGGPSVRKIRYVDEGYLRKMFEVYHIQESIGPNLMHDNPTENDLTIVTDFGHGVMTPLMIQAAREQTKYLAVNAQTNSGNYGYNLITRYIVAMPEFVCIDAPEARLALSMKIADPTMLANCIKELLSSERVIITNGKNGCAGIGLEPVQVPALTRTVVDTVGAGDAFFCIAALLSRAGATVAEAAFVGNAVGAIKVGIVGHRTAVEKVHLLKFIEALLK